MLIDMLSHAYSRLQVFSGIRDPLTRFRMLEDVRDTIHHLAEAEKSVSLAVDSFRRCKLILQEEKDFLSAFLEEAEQMLPQPPRVDARVGPLLKPFSRRKVDTFPRHVVQLPAPVDQRHVIFGVKGPSFSEKVVRSMVLLVLVQIIIELVVGPHH